MSHKIVLRALDGSEPFSISCGARSLSSSGSREFREEIQMGWERLSGFWRPKLLGTHATEEELCEKLANCRWWAPAEEFIGLLGRNITVPENKFRLFVEKACSDAKRRDRRTADFASAFGCEACAEEDKDRIEYTDLCFITGSGHQDFLGTIAALGKNVTCNHLYDALFGGWRAEKGLSMRWDPSDAAEYALQWDDPGPKGAWAVWGANRLAAEALPFFPTAPAKGGLQTTGFKRRKRQDEFTLAHLGKLYWFSFCAFPDVLCWAAERRRFRKATRANRAVLLAMGIKRFTGRGVCVLGRKPV